MKVALYYPWVYLTSGAERTILELTGRSRHRWTIFTNRFDRRHTFPGFAQREVVELPAVPVRRSLTAVARAALRLLTQRLPVKGFDALLVVCEGLGDVVVFRTHGLPTLCLCLTPLRIVFDEVYRAQYMAGRGWLNRTLVTLGAPVFRWIDRLAWRRYAHVFCISEEARRRALRGKLAPAERMEISHVGLGFYPPAPALHFGDYFLLPGRIMWTKNLELGIAAFREFRCRDGRAGGFRLIIAGIVDEKSKPYLERLRALADGEPAIEFRIFPTDDELRDLYDRCYAVLFTSFNEDWGIVPIEGMAFGKPVVAVNRGGPRESVQHGVQGYLEEPTPEAFAVRMAELAADEDAARRMGQAGRQRARLFSWDRLTDQIDDKIDELCSARQRPADAAAPAKVVAGR
ncbi:MAG: glycosyltransferase [Planctomycetes bacterium]|nr:glycosyltransferase [Planctomycetota bacterium]